MDETPKGKNRKKKRMSRVSTRALGGGRSGGKEPCRGSDERLAGAEEEDPGCLRLVERDEVLKPDLPAVHLGYP